jgi:hypothetical protein
MDRLIGSPRDRFAREVLAAVRGAGIAQAWYDRGQFAVGYRRERGTGEPDGWLYLGNIFRECQGATRTQRAGSIAGLVTGAVHHAAPPGTWGQARAHLRPVLRSGSFTLGVPHPGRAPLRRPALPYLDELVVLDRETSMEYVSDGLAETWAVPPDEVFVAARQNLAARATLPQPAGPPPTVLRFADDGNGYFVSHLLLDGWLGDLAPQVGGRPVAFAPDHNTLLVTADEPGALGRLFDPVEQEYRSAVRPVSPQAYTLDAYGRLVPYRAPDGHPLTAAVRRAEAVLACAEYQAQREWLEHEHEQDGRDIFVARLSMASRPDGTVFTFATWGEHVDTLLPRADQVAFASDGTPTFFVAWSALAREVDLVPVAGLRPDRYRLTDWPPAPVVHRLRAAAAGP